LLILQVIWVNLGNDTKEISKEFHDMLLRFLIIIFFSLVAFVPAEGQAAKKEVVVTEKKRLIQNKSARTSRQAVQNRRSSKSSDRRSKQQSKARNQQKQRPTKNKPSLNKPSINKQFGKTGNRTNSRNYASNRQKTKTTKTEKSTVRKSSSSIKPQRNVTSRAISKGTAINAAKNKVNGKVLSAKLINSQGPKVYRVKMLIGDSRVRTVFVDGETGKIIDVNQD